MVTKNGQHSKKNKNDNVIYFICSTLKWKILNGQYSVGERITEQSVAEQLHVSRNSVRTAFIKLKEEGLLTDDKIRGVVVKSISIKEANEIIDMRILLETYAVKQAINHIRDDQLDSMQVILFSMENAIKNKDYELYSELNTRFHNIIYSSTSNDLIQNLLLKLKTKMLRYQFKVAYIPGRAEKSYKEHTAIYDAIVKKDPVLAERAITDHMESLRSCVVNNKEILEIKEVVK